MAPSLKLITQVLKETLGPVIKALKKAPNIKGIN